MLIASGEHYGCTNGKCRTEIQISKPTLMSDHEVKSVRCCCCGSRMENMAMAETYR